MADIIRSACLLAKEYVSSRRPEQAYLPTRSGTALPAPRLKALSTARAKNLKLYVGSIPRPTNPFVHQEGCDGRTARLARAKPVDARGFNCQLAIFSSKFWPQRSLAESNDIRYNQIVFGSRGSEEPPDGALGEIPHRAASTRIEYGVEIRSCNLGAALGAIKLGEGEHLLRSRGTAGDSFVGFDRIFERHRVYSRHL